jgi:hypothetical protein
MVDIVRYYPSDELSHPAATISDKHEDYQVIIISIPIVFAFGTFRKCTNPPIGDIVPRKP